MTVHALTLTDVFTLADCWALAYALADRYVGLSPHVLADDNGGWCHMLVQDARDGTYVDILGAQTFEEVQAAWDWEQGWVSIESADALGVTERGMERRFPQVSIDEAIAHLVESGWAPPPLRG